MWNEGKMSRLSQGDLFPVYILFFPDNTDNIIIITQTLPYSMNCKDSL